MSNVVSGYSVSYQCSECKEAISVTLGDLGLSYFRMGNPIKKCRKCKTENHIEVIREFKDLPLYEKTLFILGFWSYFDFVGFFNMFKIEFEENKTLISKVLFCIWAIPFSVFFMFAKFFWMLVLNLYWLPIGIFINGSRTYRSIKRTRHN
jgi:hypothetical protein